MTNSPTNVAVIGAGVTGTTTAYNLVRRGYDVTLYDKNLSLLKTSSAAETVAFQIGTGYRPWHVLDRLSPETSVICSSRKPGFHAYPLLETRRNRT